MPRAILHGIDAFDATINPPLLRLDGPRLSDGRDVLMEYNGTFWKYSKAYYSAIQLEGVKSITLTFASGASRLLEAPFEASIAGNFFWNGRTCVAMLIDGRWIDRSTDEALTAIEFRD